MSGAIIFLSAPEAIKHCLKDNFTNYVKGDMFRDGLGEFLGEGIFVADGALWKLHRKVASHMFSTRLLRESCAVANRHADRLLSLLRSTCSKAPGGSAVVDIQVRLTFQNSGWVPQYSGSAAGGGARRIGAKYLYFFRIALWCKNIIAHEFQFPLSFSSLFVCFFLL